MLDGDGAPKSVTRFSSSGTVLDYAAEGSASVGPSALNSYLPIPRFLFRCRGLFCRSCKRFRLGRGYLRADTPDSSPERGDAIEDRDTPQPEGLTLSLQVGATRSLRSAELDPEIGNLARKNRIRDDRNKANITRSIRMAGEILSRSPLRERELLLAQVAPRYRKIARIDARARRHATREHHGEPEEDYGLHTVSTRECGEW